MRKLLHLLVGWEARWHTQGDALSFRVWRADIRASADVCQGVSR